MSKMSQHVYEQQLAAPETTEDMVSQSSFTEDSAYENWAENYDHETQEMRGESK